METKEQRKLRLLKELQDLEIVETDDVEDLAILRGKGDIEPKEKNKTISGNKKPRTEAQIKTFEKARETARLNAEKRKTERDMRAEEERILMEEKVVKKAISLKKKQIKQQAVLDEISDDDTPIEKIKEIVKKLPKKGLPTAVELPAKREPPKYRFY
jgi:hypothetical protein